MLVRLAALAGMLLLLPAPSPAAGPPPTELAQDLRAWVAEHGLSGAVRLTTWGPDGVHVEATLWRSAENLIGLVEQRLAYLQDQPGPGLEDALGLPGIASGAGEGALHAAPTAVGGGKNLDPAGACGAVLVRLAWMGYGSHPILLSAVPLLAGPVPEARFCTPQNGNSQDALWAEIVLDGQRGGDGYWYNTAAAQVRLFPLPDGGPLWADDVHYAVVRGAARAFLFDACDFFCFSYLAVEGDGATVELYDALPPRLGALSSG